MWRGHELQLLLRFVVGLVLARLICFFCTWMLEDPSRSLPLICIECQCKDCTQADSQSTCPGSESGCVFPNYASDKNCDDENVRLGVSSSLTRYHVAYPMQSRMVTLKVLCLSMLPCRTTVGAIGMEVPAVARQPPQMVAMSKPSFAR